MNHELTNLLPIASTGGEEPGFVGLVFYVGLVLLVLGIVIWIVRGGLKDRVFKNPLTQAAEQMYLFIEAMCVNIIGERGRKYIPFIGTLWLMIFVGNTVALFFAFAPTADLSFNLAMALIAVGYVQHEGIKQHADAERRKGRDVFTAWFIGFFKHLAHFSGPKLTGLLLIITPLLFIVELISEVMKNVSLSLRLFGNIHGGHVAVEALNEVGKPIYAPLGGLLLVVKLLTVVVQALVFTLLTCVYISLVTHDEHEHDDHSPAMAH
jgi:F-type H+-transporting ATPase subunit a